MRIFLVFFSGGGGFISVERAASLLGASLLNVVYQPLDKLVISN